MKIKAFEYLLYKLLEWYEEEYGHGVNDLSIVKTMKLLFFVSAADKNNDILDTTFTEFFAMPYGHIEKDIYEHIKNTNGELNYFILTNKSVKMKDNVKIIDLIKELPLEIRLKIDQSIVTLKKLNNNIIKYNSFELIELSQSWYSWAKNYRIARSNDLYSIKIPINNIKTESKIFYLNIFH